VMVTNGFRNYPERGTLAGHIEQISRSHRRRMALD
jgi:hypothetical protein